MRHKIFWDSEIQTDYQISSRKLDRVLINKVERICHMVENAVTVNYCVKRKESKKINKYLGLAWQLKKLWNMRAMVVPWLLVPLERLTKSWERDWENWRSEEELTTIQITTLSRSVWILRRVLLTWGNLISFKLLSKTIS